MPRISKTSYPRAAEATVAAVLGAVALFAGPSSPARASSIDVECLGDFARTFSPAVTATPQTVTVTEANDYGTCVIGSTGTGAATISPITLSCVPATAGPAYVETVTWTDATGGSSTISWSAPTVVAQTVVFTGTVTSGRYVGDSATKVTSGISYLGSVVGCLLGTPISSTTGLIDSLLLTH